MIRRENEHLRTMSISMKKLKISKVKYNENISLLPTIYINQSLVSRVRCLKIIFGSQSQLILTTISTKCYVQE